jgi:type VI secretion system protein VasL
MHDAQQAMNVGRDPRMLPEYERLRGEINKLSHASRPEIDWQLVHQMAMIIFEKQGVDLQTAIYFTLARSRLHGLNGFTEGCEFLANLIVTQWDNFWPPVHQARARVDMLDWFIARISDVIRQYSISHEDKRYIYRCERALQLMSEKLHNVGLSRVPRVENLIHFIEGYTHLFDETEIVIVSDEQDIHQQDMQIPPMVYFRPDSDSAQPGMEQAMPKGSIIVGREKGALKPTVLKIETHKKAKPAWFWFASGLLACALPVALFAGWDRWTTTEAARENDAITLLGKPARALPGALNFSELRNIRMALGEQTLREMEPEVTSNYQAQLTRVQQASPLWLYQFGDDLRNSVRVLYPDSLAVNAMDTQWQQMLRAQTGDKHDEAAWQQANRSVDGLIAELMDLERKRKTVTISYLKSAVYDIQKNLNREVPFSVRLGQLEKRQAAQERISPTELNAMLDELKGLNTRMYLLEQTRTAP